MDLRFRRAVRKRPGVRGPRGKEERKKTEKRKNGSMEQNQEKRFALLIDADNIGSQYIKVIVEEITDEGVLTYKRIYGDWTSQRMKSWKDILLEYSITPVQQYSYTTGKNATDSAMIIDAMDILYSGRVDGFCLASSDSDFTRLAARLREEGMTVIGMGKQQTPRPFVSACSKFKYIDILTDAAKAPVQEADQTEQKPKDDASKNGGKDKGRKDRDKNGKNDKQQSSRTPKKTLLASISGFLEENGEENGGWVNMSLVGNMLQKKYPDFDPKNYGYKKMIELLPAWGFEVEKFIDPNSKADPPSLIIYVRLSADRK